MSKHVCVIGAGPSGLVTIKELLDEGHTVDCFESSIQLGGVFSGKGSTSKRVYDNLTLTISNYYMCFSDYPPKDNYKYWNAKEYLKYLQSYASHFGLDSCITYNTKVVNVKKENEKWTVTTQTDDNIDKRQYDAVAVCTGTHQTENIPMLVQNYKNMHPNIIDHSSQFGSTIEASKYKDKRVLVIGMGETSADIVREISNVSKECHLVMKSYPFCIPRLTKNGTPVDSGTCYMRYPQSSDSVCVWMLACIYLLMWIPFYFIQSKFKFNNSMWKWWNEYPENEDAMGQLPKGKFMDKSIVISKAAVEKMAEWHMKGNTSQLNKFATKNVTWVPNVISGKINVHISQLSHISYISHISPILQLKPLYNDNGYCSRDENETVHKNDNNHNHNDNDNNNGTTKIVLRNGDTFNVDYILCCTGYKDEFPFFMEGEFPNNVKNLFKHAFNVNIGHSLCFIGFSRPTTGAIPACSELVARYFSLLVSGKKTLPDSKDATQMIETDKYNEDNQFYNSFSVKTLVNPTEYMDSLAQLIGCYTPPLYFAHKPKEYLRWLTCLNLPCRYRLNGPHSNIPLAKSWIDLSLSAYSPYQCLLISFTKLLYTMGIGTSDYEVDMRIWSGKDMMLSRYDIKYI